MPPKVRELSEKLENAGFQNRGGKGSRPVTISGRLGDDAKRYQEKAVAKALREIEP